MAADCIPLDGEQANYWMQVASYGNERLDILQINSWSLQDELCSLIGMRTSSWLYKPLCTSFFKGCHSQIHGYPLNRPGGGVFSLKDLNAIVHIKCFSSNSGCIFWCCGPR